MFTGLRQTLSGIRTKISQFTTPTRVLVVATAAIVLGLLLVWIANQVATYFVTRSYVEQIAKVFDINVHLANALTWIVFAILVVLGFYTFSFSRRKRLIGFSGILALLAANS